MNDDPYQKLTIWSDSHRLAVVIHDLANRFPYNERHVLADQLKRSSKSVPANIAEGTGYFSWKDTLRFFSMARGSAHETMEHLALARDLKYVDEKAANYLIGRYRGISAGITAYCNRTKIRFSQNAK